MDSLADYVQWMGDFPIAATGFRDADALVLCALSYIDLSPLFADGAESCRLSDSLPLAEGGLRVMISGEGEGYLRLLRLCAASKRFGRLTLSAYRDLFRQDPPLQFSALCFSDEELSFLAFRGTDSSLAGWQEDFMISFTRTEAQELALRYAREQVRPGRRWIIGGHSKGSNLALYAASLLDAAAWGAVERLYLLDGPGFCPEVLSPALTGRIEAKTTQIVPRFCVVGKLFAPRIADTRIVQSSASGFLQHAPISWGIDHGALALAPGHDPVSQIINEAVDAWIAGISQADRAVFVGELFDVLAAGGAETLDQLKKGGPEGLEAILRRLNEASDTTKRTLSNLPKFALKVQVDKLRERVSEAAELLAARQ